MWPAHVPPQSLADEYYRPPGACCRPLCGAWERLPAPIPWSDLVTQRSAVSGAQLVVPPFPTTAGRWGGAAQGLVAAGPTGPHTVASPWSHPHSLVVAVAKPTRLHKGPLWEGLLFPPLQKLSFNLIKPRCKAHECQGVMVRCTSLTTHPPCIVASDHQSEAYISVALCQLEAIPGDDGLRAGLCPGATQLGVCMPPPCGGVTGLNACAHCHAMPEMPENG